MAFRGVLTDMRDGQTTTSNTITGTLPGTAAAGDACILAIFQATGNTATTPSGWTVLSGKDAQANTLSAYVYGKVLSAADITAGSITITWSGAGRDIGVGIVMSGEDGTTPFQTPLPSAVVQGSGATVTPPAVSAGGATQDLIIIVGSRTTTGTAPSIGTPSGWTSRDQNATNFGSGAANVSAAVFTNTGTGTVTPGSASVSNTPNASIAYTIALDTQVTVSPPLATATAQMFVPTISTGAVVTPPLATATGQAFVPTISTGAVVTPPLATATGQMFVPTVTTGATVSPPLATATGQMFAPTVTTGATVTPPLATATGQAFPPTVVISVTPPLATASGQMFAPTVSTVQDVTISPPMMLASILFPVPTVTAQRHVTINPPLATGTAQAFPPTVTGGATVTPPRATVAGQMFAPGRAHQIIAPLMSMVGQAFPPVVTVSVEILVPTITTDGLMFVPTVREIIPRHLTLDVRMAAERWDADLVDRWDTDVVAGRWDIEILEET